MEAIRRLIGHIILNTDTVELILLVCGLLIVWIAGMALIRQWRNRK